MSRQTDNTIWPITTHTSNGMNKSEVKDNTLQERENLYPLPIIKRVGKDATSFECSNCVTRDKGGKIFVLGKMYLLSRAGELKKGRV